MSKTAEKRAKRESLLLGWFREGVYGLKSIIQMLNENLEKPVSDNTVDLDIKRLKSKLKSEGEELVNQDGVYRIIKSDGSVDFNHDERLMLPLIEGLLQPYSIIPGVTKLMQELKSTHITTGIEEAVLNNAVAFTSPHNVLAYKTQQIVFKIIKCMFKGEACFFNYSDVHQRTNDSEHQVFPIQIRENLGRLYLTALPIGREISGKNLRVFALDCIERGQLDTLEEFTDESTSSAYDQWTTPTKVLRYNYIQMLEKLDFNNYFNGVVGVWRPPTVEPQLVERYFAGWAISHVTHSPIHPTQKTIWESPAKVQLAHLNDPNPQPLVKIQWKIHKTPELSFRLGSYRDYSWDAKIGAEGPGADHKLNWEY